MAAVLLNSNRSEDTEAFSPFDFVTGLPEQDEEEVEREKLRRSTKKAIAVAFAGMDHLNREEVLAKRAEMVRSMTANGVTDADELIREVFPEL